MVFPNAAIVKAATLIQELEATVIFFIHGPRIIVVFVSLRNTIYPRIRLSGMSGRGSHWTVMDDQPCLLRDDFGGGRRVSAKEGNGGCNILM